MADAAGFRIDTGYSNKDPLDKTQKQAGQGYRGYATFVKNDAQGNTSKVGSGNPGGSATIQNLTLFTTLIIQQTTSTVNSMVKN